MKPCGTYAASQRHIRLNEKMCDACAKARLEYQRKRFAPKNQGKPCAICDAPLGLGKIKYCSRDCSTKALVQSAAYRRAQEARNSKPRKTIERLCEHCGAPWMVEQSSPSRYCSLVCAKAKYRTCRDLVYVGPAEFCWIPIDHPVMRWSSKLQPQSRPATWWKMFVSGCCAWCGEQYVGLSNTGRSTFCSKRCESRSTKSKRRGKQFTISPVKRLAIYERDHWTCQLCNESVDPSLIKGYEDWAPSLDHIVPRSKGGGDGLENLRLTHRWCNAIRGAEDYHSDLFAA